MRSDILHVPTSYLRRVLLDGAKPFLYRSRVRSLLGVPDGGGGEVSFSPIIPPVGFTYLHSQFMREPDIPQYPLDQTVPSALYRQGVALENSAEIAPKSLQYHPSALARAERMTHSGISRAQESGENEVMPKGMTQQGAATPESSQPDVTKSVSEQEKSSVEPSEMAERPSTAFERATIHIPGASERNQDFPALSLSEQREPLSPKAEAHPQHQLSHEGARQSSLQESRSAGQEHELPPAPTVDVARAAERLLRVGITRSVISGQGTGGGDVERGDVPVKYTSPPPKRAPLPRSTGRERTLNPSFDMSGHMDPGTDNGPSRAADSIEQLRTAVHELAAKKSPQREQTRDDAQPQRQQTPPPVQQVVIVRQPSRQARIPHAFWERSYLGRVRARILR
jgi:hypothetical protein